MNGNTKFLIGFLAGAAAGAAVTVFLTSDKGKELLSGFRSAVSKAGEDLKDVVNDFGEQKTESSRSKNQKENVS